MFGTSSNMSQDSTNRDVGLMVTGISIISLL
jgi:hypothetical protein